MESSAAATSASPMHYLVAVDGSPVAHLAFQIVMESLLHAADKITVAHIFNDNKTYLPFDMQPGALKSTYESHTLLLGSRATLWWESAESKTSTKEQMINLAGKVQASLVVIGMHGRKGPKSDPTVLGSAVQHISLNPYSPMLIIKDKNGLRSQHPGGNLRFACCTDGSEKSLRTLSFMSRLVDRARGDQLLAICVDTTKVVATEVNEEVKKHLSREGISDFLSGFVTLKKRSQTDSVDQVIVDYLMAQVSEETYIDFVGVGNTGADFSSHLGDKKYLGSVANGVIRKSNLNVLFFA